MIYKHRPELLLGNTEGGFESIEDFDGYDVTLDCFKSGNPVVFDLWHSTTTRSTWSRVRRLAKCGAPFVFRMDGATLVNGRIDDVRELVGREGGAHIVISGRDIAAQGQDWDADPAVNFRQTTVEEAVKGVWAALGVDVIVGARADDARAIQTRPVRAGGRGTSATSARRQTHTRKVIDRLHPQAGEKVWDLSEAIVRRAGLWQWVAPVESLGKMALILDRFDYKSAPLYEFIRRYEPFGGTTSGNLLETVHHTQIRTVPTKVRVYGHCGRGDKYTFRYNALHPAPGTANDLLYDARITAGRVFLPPPVQPRFAKSQRARTYEESNQEAERIYARAMRDLRRYTASVQGHGQNTPGGFVLYAPNTTATVLDDVLELNERMFVHRCQYRGGRSLGTETHVSMVPLNAVQLTVGVVEGE